MKEILGFFQEIADGIRNVFDMFGKVFDILKTIKDVFANIGDTVRMATNILPPQMLAAIMVLIGIITVVAILKYAGFGGSVDD